MNGLFKLVSWEAARPVAVRYDKVYLTENSQDVRKVEGRVIHQDKTRKAEWDGYGRCVIRNKRNRDYDISLQ